MHLCAKYGKYNVLLNLKEKYREHLDYLCSLCYADKVFF